MSKCRECKWLVIGQHRYFCDAPTVCGTLTEAAVNGDKPCNEFSPRLVAASPAFVRCADCEFSGGLVPGAAVRHFWCHLSGSQDHGPFACGCTNGLPRAKERRWILCSECVDGIEDLLWWNCKRLGGSRIHSSQGCAQGCRAGFRKEKERPIIHCEDCKYRGETVIGDPPKHATWFCERPGNKYEPADTGCDAGELRPFVLCKDCQYGRQQAGVWGCVRSLPRCLSPLGCRDGKAREKKDDARPEWEPSYPPIHFDVTEMREWITRLEKDNQWLNVELRKAEASREGSDAEIDALHAENERLVAENRRLDGQRNRFKMESEGLAGGRDWFRSEVIRLEAENKDLRAANAALKTEKTKLLTDVVRAKNQEDYWFCEASDRREQIDELTAANAKLEEENARLRKTIEEKSGFIGALIYSRAAVELEKENKELTAEIARLKEENERLVEQTKGLGTQIFDMHRAIDELTKLLRTR